MAETIRGSARISGLLIASLGALGGCAAEARFDSHDVAAAAFEDAPECVAELETAAVAADMAQVVADECAEDSGPCNAVIGDCAGAVEDRICDPIRFVVTPSAAICMAKAHGLQQGLRAPTAEIMYHYNFRRALWAVKSVLLDNSDDHATDREGQIFFIDAVTGAVVGGTGLMWREIS